MSNDAVRTFGEEVHIIIITWFYLQEEVEWHKI